MDILHSIKALLNSSEKYISTRKFFFEIHDCSKLGKEVKVNLDYKIQVGKSDKIVTFGLCEHCKTLFYHEDFESDSKL